MAIVRYGEFRVKLSFRNGLILLQALPSLIIVGNKESRTRFTRNGFLLYCFTFRIPICDVSLLVYQLKRTSIGLLGIEVDLLALLVDAIDALAGVGA